MIKMTISTSLEVNFLIGTLAQTKIYTMPIAHDHWTNCPVKNIHTCDGCQEWWNIYSTGAVSSAQPTQLCALPGCSNSVYPGQNYCRRDHGRQHQAMQQQVCIPCSKCRLQQANPGHSWCESCFQASRQPAPGASMSGPICARPGCSRPCWPGHPYCGKTCAGK